jgi:hypothetical protein
LAGGNLATDKDGNIFVWNGDTKTHFRGFTPLLEVLFREDLSIKHLKENRDKNLQPKSNLFFGTNGTLCAGAIGAKLDLRAILPQYTLGANSSADISSPTHLQVDGTATNDKSWTLSARGEN